MGGGGLDVLVGREGNDQLYAGSQITMAAAIAAGATQTGSGQRGDWLAGGSGDDLLVGGASDDGFSAAAARIIIADGGNDSILGDADLPWRRFPVCAGGARVRKNITSLYKRDEVYFA